MAPYIDDDDGLYSFLSLLSTLLTLFCGLVLKGKSVNPDEGDAYESYAITALLITCNASVVIIFLVMFMNGKKGKGQSKDWKAKVMVIDSLRHFGRFIQYACTRLT